MSNTEQVVTLMALGHALSGAILGLSGCLGAQAFGADITPATAFAAAALGSGGAMLPDWDHPSATAARTFGPFSRFLARLINASSMVIYDRTRTDLDVDRDGGHRGITHTIVFALFAGTGSDLAARSYWGLLAVLFVMLALGLRGLVGPKRLDKLFDKIMRFALRRVIRKRTLSGRFWRWFLRYDQAWLAMALLSAAASWATVGALPPGQAADWVGGSVAMGCWAHCLGDSLTKSGCPWLWPIKIKGQRWYPIGSPKRLRFKTGRGEDGKVSTETKVTRIVLIPATVLLAITTVPGGWAALADGWTALANLVPS
jgi:membrane-bound metal-dependent hydrolase YbcI (DUF457 family)